MTRMRVLVFPSGTEAGLEVAHALEPNVHVELYGASSRDDHGALTFARHECVPNIADPDFDERFSQLLSKWCIDLVFATHDDVQEYLATRLPGWGACLVNGDSKAASVARRKSATYALFADAAWIPAVHVETDEIGVWPVAVKPDRGQGGKGFHLARTAGELAIALAAIEDPMICEYLPGQELTVDCFTDRHGRLLHVGPRSRERVAAGIAMRSRRVGTDAEVKVIAEAINLRLDLRGPWFFQVKRDAHGRWKLLEFSCRLSSSSVVQRAAGVNLPLMTVQDHMQRDLRILQDSRVTRVERCLATTAVLDYEFDVACFDLDDTLLCDGRANPRAMRLVYRLLQLDKRLVLLTRHPGDPLPALEAAHIPLTLFDRVVHLRPEEPKSAHVPVPAIFIDNHFPERLDVAHNCGVPVFDVDALDLLFP